jgi:citrate lyase subunit beta/citryl-CoA lyase
MPTPSSLPRTYLFVPGDRPERFDKALGTAADAVVLDLEDAVSPDRKRYARDAMARWCERGDVARLERVVVRVNNAQSSEFADDLRLISELGVRQVMLAKAEKAAHVGAVLSAAPGAGVLALVETARGVAAAEILAACPGVSRLVFGTLDYALDLDLDITDSADGLAHAAAVVAVASRVADLPPPVAGVTPQIDDPSRLLDDWTWSRRHGFGAKLCIHPKQIDPLHAAMAPSPQEIAWAERVLGAEAASPGAGQLDGRMIDRPVVSLAERTLQRAGKR